MTEIAARGGVPSAGTALATLVGVTWRRFFRSRTLWVAALIGGLPILVAVLMAGRRHVADVITVVEFLVLVLLPPVFVAASLGEEIEERTTTYLWSRPLPRWTIVIGKLIALAPIAAALVTGGWFVAISMVTDKPPSTDSVIAFASGSLVVATLSTGMATLVPKHAMALTLVYLVVVDLPIGAIPAPLQSASITYQVRMMSGIGEPPKLAASAIAMAIIAGVWLAIALWRIRRLES